MMRAARWVGSGGPGAAQKISEMAPEELFKGSALGLSVSNEKVENLEQRRKVFILIWAVQYQPAGGFVAPLAAHRALGPF